MARKRGLHKPEEEFPEPNLLPLMNILFMLILVLVGMSSMLPLGFISSESQKIAKGGFAVEKYEEKKPLNLTIFITSTGFNFAVFGDVKMGLANPFEPSRKSALIPLKASAYDFLALKTKLIEFKLLDPAEEAVTITADPEVKFDIIVETMDAARYDNDGKLLFPRVSFAAGVVG
jgi:biopolymer transport protein ExbD